MHIYMLKALDTKDGGESSGFVVRVIFASGEDNATFTPTHVLPEGYALLDTKWVFRAKLLASMYLDKRKARWCIRGDMQEPGTYDPFTCFAPTPAPICIKYMLNLAL
jgi:hypothetical protein